MIVFRKNGKTVVLTGWRAWLFGAAAFAVAFTLVCLVTFVFLGLAVTVGAVLLIVLPLAAVLTALSWVLGGRP